MYSGSHLDAVQHYIARGVRVQHCPFVSTFATDGLFAGFHTRLGMNSKANIGVRFDF